MSVNAVIGTHTPPIPEETITSGHHPPITTTKAVKTSQGILSAGLIVGLNSDDKIVPYNVDTKSLGTGDGSNKDFSGTLTNAPLMPESVTVTDGTKTLKDDGHGNLYGDGSGTVNYKTGKASASFTSAPSSGAAVSATGARRPAGVLLERCDTDKEDACVIVIHGSVWEERISVDGATLSQDDIARLEAIGVFVVP